MLLVGAACKREHGDARRDPTPPRQASPQADILQRYPIHAYVRWTDVRDEEGLPSEERVEERWIPASGTDGGVYAWTMVPSQPDRKLSSSTETRYERRPEGLVMVRTITDGMQTSYEPPYLLLPSDAHVGQSFGGEHHVAGSRIDRKCRIVQHACADGIEVRCTLRFPSGTELEVVNEYCGGVGIVGFRQTQRAPGGGVIRHWAKDLRVD